MAAALNRTWCRIVTSKQFDFKVVQHISRCYTVSSVKRKDGVMNRVKKFVFGESIELPESDSVYYDLEETKTPLIYYMDPSEIKEKFDSIMNEVGHDSKNISDDLMKYKILCRCHEEFGVLFPSFQLSSIAQLQDIEDFYCRAKQPSKSNTLNILDIENTPPNLKIGGKVPRK